MSNQRRVAAAIAASPRARHLPPEQRAFADEDTPLPLFNCQTNSQPSTVETMLRLLDVPVGARVLDVGAGSGWTTAILARLVGSTGTVLGVERDPDLAAWGADNLAATRQSWARIEPVRPGVLGAPKEGPFDRILVSAMATELPSELVAQLVPGGVLVIPVDGRLLKVVRTAQDPPDEAALQVRSFGRYRFVPLITD